MGDRYKLIVAGKEVISIKVIINIREIAIDRSDKDNKIRIILLPLIFFVHISRSNIKKDIIRNKTNVLL